MILITVRSVCLSVYVGQGRTVITRTLLVRILSDDFVGTNSNSNRVEHYPGTW